MNLLLDELLGQPRQEGGTMKALIDQSGMPEIEIAALVRARIYAAAELIASGEEEFSCVALMACALSPADYREMLSATGDCVPVNPVELARRFRPLGLSLKKARAHRVIALLMFAEWIGA